jgi:hypothetical protein
MFVKAVSGTMMLVLLFLSGKCVMTRLLPALTVRDDTIHNRKHFVEVCPPKMLTDGDSIVSNERNFDVFRVHPIYPFNRLYVVWFHHFSKSRLG